MFGFIPIHLGYPKRETGPGHNNQKTLGRAKLEMQLNQNKSLRWRSARGSERRDSGLVVEPQLDHLRGKGRVLAPQA